MSLRVRALLCSFAFISLSACAERDPFAPRPDASLEDAGSADGGTATDGGRRRDGGTFDGGGSDGGGNDGGLVDGGGDDGGVLDGGSDGGSSDGGAPRDGGPRDAGIVVPDGGNLACETGGVTHETEPNDRPTQANVLSPGVALRGKLTPENDEDWYVFVACQKTLLDVGFEMTGPAVPPPDAGAPFGTPVDPRIDVIGPDGTTLLNWVQNRAGSAGPTSMHVVVLVEEPGPIYLRVTDIGSNGRDDQDSYTLTATTAPIPDAQQEPDGNKGPVLSAALAHPMTENVLSQGYLASTRDEDWWKLHIDAASIVDVTLTDAPATGTPLAYRMRIFAADGLTELGRAEARPPAPTASVTLRLRAQLPAAGDYYLVISDQGDASDRTRPYHIVYQRSTIPDLALEPNDRPADARPLGLGTPVSAYIAAPADQDWFSVVVPSPSILRAELTVTVGLRSPVDYRVALFAPDGVTEISESTDFDGSFGDIDVVTAGFAAGGAAPYFVRVSDWRADDYDVTNPYRLVVTTLTLPDAAIEPNDAPATATVVRPVPGTPVDVTAYIATQRDVDFFAVDITAGQSITASLTAGLTSVQYRLSIRDGQGQNRLADAYDVNGRMLPNDLSVTAPLQGGTMPLAAGRYFVTVEDLGGDDFDPSVPYHLTISVANPMTGP